MNDFAKTLIITGLVLTAAGLLISLPGKTGGWLGRLPGDIYIRKGSSVLYFPVATCILISILLTLFFNFFGKR